jgi:phosphoribosyl 1,2-cyclic phosphodiesterase
MAFDSISVKFWGVRGSIPCPGPDTLRFGGNTACVEIRCGESLLIFDAGSGLRELGNELSNIARVTDADLFLSHCHIDHVIGLPFFSPIFDEKNRIHLWAGNMHSAGGIKAAIHKLMSHPMFPIDIETLQSKVTFKDFNAGENLQPRSGIIVQTAKLNHPGGATGYRIEYADRAVAYITDIELDEKPFDPALLALVQNAALVIIDATYTDEELSSHAGWGHSSWQQTVRLANQAHVGKLCLFHHDPDHTDVIMEQIAVAAEKARPGTIVAREGLTIVV